MSAKAQPSVIRKSGGAALLAAAFLGVSACASSYGANQVSPRAVRTVSTIRQGVVLSVREVQIRPEDSQLGAFTGAALGGVGGSAIGGGRRANAAGAIAGAVLGGIIGNEVGKGLNTQRGFAYVVEFDSGEVREIIQGDDLLIQPGTAVNVTFRADGATVTPA